MALHEDVRPLLAARAASDPAAAKLLEMFTRSDEDLRLLSQNGPSPAKAATTLQICEPTPLREQLSYDA